MLGSETSDDSDVLNNYYNRLKMHVINTVNEDDYSKTSCDEISSKYVEILPIYTSSCTSIVSWRNVGLKSSNFVYGEVSMIDLYNVFIKYLDFDNTKSLKFVSLGCGSGPCMSAAYFSQKFHTIVGIELMKSKIRECEYLFKLLSSDYKKNDIIKTEVVFSEKNKNIDQLMTLNTTITEIDIIYNNFLSVDWSDADVVYCCATCLADDVLFELASLCQKLKKGSYIILIDRQDQFQKYLSEKSINNLILSSMITSSWGPCQINLFRLV